MSGLNKKAVSAVVATVLIILITVAAIGIIWAAVIPMVRDNLAKGSACNDALTDIVIQTSSSMTCVNKTANQVELQVSKGQNTKVKLVGLNVLITIDGSTTKVLVDESTIGKTTGDFAVGGKIPTDLETQMIKITSEGGVDFSKATEVQIAPIVSVGKAEETCGTTQRVILDACK